MEHSDRMWNMFGSIVLDQLHTSTTVLLVATCPTRGFAHCMRQVRIELTTLGLWDLRATNCATAAAGVFCRLLGAGPKMPAGSQGLRQGG